MLKALSVLPLLLQSGARILYEGDQYLDFYIDPELSQYFHISTIVGDILRAVGEIIVNVLRFIYMKLFDGLNAVYSVLALDQYLQDTGFFAIYKPLIYSVLGIAIVVVGILLIVGSDKIKGKKFIQNLALALAVIMLLPAGIMQMNNLTEAWLQEHQNIISQDGIPFSGCIVDLEYVFDDIQGGGSAADEISAIKAKIKAKDTILNFDDTAFQYISFTERIYPDMSTPIFCYRAVRNQMGTKYTIPIDVPTILGVKAGDMEMFQHYYYRYHVEWLAIILIYAGYILVLAFTILRCFRLILEIVVKHLIAPFVAAGDLATGVKIRTLLKNLLFTYITLMYCVTALLLFRTVITFLFETDTFTPFIKGLFTCLATYAVIDGPKIMQDIFGIDAGLSDGFTAFDRLMRVGRAATNRIKAVADAGKKAGDVLAGNNKDSQKKDNPDKPQGGNNKNNDSQGKQAGDQQNSGGASNQQQGNGNPVPSSNVPPTKKDGGSRRGQNQGNAGGTSGSETAHAGAGSGTASAGSETPSSGNAGEGTPGTTAQQSSSGMPGQNAKNSNKQTGQSGTGQQPKSSQNQNAAGNESKQQPNQQGEDQKQTASDKAQPAQEQDNKADGQQNASAEAESKATASSNTPGQSGMSGIPGGKQASAKSSAETSRTSQGANNQGQKSDQTATAESVAKATSGTDNIDGAQQTAASGSDAGKEILSAETKGSAVPGQQISETADTTSTTVPAPENVNGSGPANDQQNISAESSVQTTAETSGSSVPSANAASGQQNVSVRRQQTVTQTASSQTAQSATSGGQDVAVTVTDDISVEQQASETVSSSPDSGVQNIDVQGGQTVTVTAETQSGQSAGSGYSSGSENITVTHETTVSSGSSGTAYSAGSSGSGGSATTTTTIEHIIQTRNDAYAANEAEFRSGSGDFTQQTISAPMATTNEAIASAAYDGIKNMPSGSMTYTEVEMYDRSGSGESETIGFSFETSEDGRRDKSSYTRALKRAINQWFDNADSDTKKNYRARVKGVFRNNRRSR